MTFHSILLSLHLIVAIALIGLVMLQQGRGADAGAAFGSGSAGSVFGARGPASFLTRTTAVLATLFFVTSLMLGYLAAHRDQKASVVETVGSPTSAPVNDLPSLPGSSNEQSDLPGLPGQTGSQQ